MKKTYKVDKNAIVFENKRREIGEIVEAYPDDEIVKVLKRSKFLIEVKDE